MSVVPMEDMLDHPLAHRHGAASDILDDLTTEAGPSAATAEHAPSVRRTSVETVAQHGCDRLSGILPARRYGAHVEAGSRAGTSPVPGQVQDPDKGGAA